LQVEQDRQMTVLQQYLYLLLNLIVELGIRSRNNAYVLLGMNHHSYHFHILGNALLEELLAV
jgi:hypothetical protein